MYVLHRQNFPLLKILFIIILVVFLINSYAYYPSKSTCSTYYFALPLISTRNELVKILRDEEFQNAAEIGVQQGAYAEYLLSNWAGCIEYHAIDLWKNQANYADRANVLDDQQQQNYEVTRQRLKKWEAIVRYHRNYSVYAATEIKDNSLDFVYIDARHDYTGVWEDMESYWPKLKCGGIFAGHDFLDAHEVPGQDWSIDHRGIRRADGKAVKSAVIEFVLKHKRELFQTSNEAWPTWYFRK